LGLSKNPTFVIAGLTRNLCFTTRLRLGGRNDDTENTGFSRHPITKKNNFLFQRRAKKIVSAKLLQLIRNS